MSKIKKIYTNWRIILLVAVIILAIFAINPNPWQKGVAIRSVVANSSADLAGMKSATPNSPPMGRERILEINNVPVNNLDEYYNQTALLYPDTTVLVKTNKQIYKLTLNKVDSSGNIDLGLKVYEAPTTNLRKGLDLQGGTRVLLQPEKKISRDEMDVLLSNMKERLNVFGLSDIVVREVSDLSGNQYILVEIAGANEEEVKELIAKQGKFEAKIGNETAFMGGADIKQVCRTAECSGIDTTQGCGNTADGNWACRFRFAITLSVESAQNQAALTQNLTIVPGQAAGQGYLDKPLDLYLDNQLVDSLQISEGLKGKAATDIEISGSGVGATEQEAQYNALQNMKRLQTILITGSLPVKLEIAKTDSLSPVLGEEFLKSAMIMGLVAILAVILVLLIAYRKFWLAIPIGIAMIAEVVILLGFAAISGWNIDMAAIAGIIVAVGTGVDDQIVITDETLRGERATTSYAWKQKIKNAFFIIMAAYFSVVVAMVPLLFAGAGLLKGFALTTIVGVSIGVFITRPAYAAIVEILVRED